MKLSIITVNLNNAESLRKTVDSVVNQSFVDYEYIIIDGGSTDGSIEVIKEYADKITYWVSEPDNGIYNAMNKGILKAKGEYCYFLNSGDWLIDINSISSIFYYQPVEDIIYCNIETTQGLIVYPLKLSLLFFFSGTICHQAAFLKTNLFYRFGIYNENLKIVADWEFFIKAIILNNCSYKYINKIVSFFELGGISSKEDILVKNEKLDYFRQKQPIVYEIYIHYLATEQQLLFYKNSRLIQFVKKMQESSLYRKIRNIS